MLLTLISLNAKAQLKSLGDQIEAIAKKLEAQGTKVDCEGLYEMGDRIVHFLDSVDENSPINKKSEPSSYASFDKKTDVSKDKSSLS